MQNFFKFKKLFFISLLLMFFCNIVFASDKITKNAWSIDKFMRFQIAYLPDTSVPFKEGTMNEAAKPLLQPYYLPDINNINLAKFLDLGFDVPRPANVDQYNFYLKLYEFPKGLPSDQITSKFLSDFALDKIQNVMLLRDYISEQKNLVIKLAYIAKAQEKFTDNHPMPVLQTSNDVEFAKYFIEYIPFYSLYLNSPIKVRNVHAANLAAKQSTKGVQNFFKNLLFTYRNNLSEIKGVDENYYYFAPKKVSDDSKKITILKIPKKILIFANWRELPMPQDPNKIFLTSLLLVYKTDYLLKTGVTIPTVFPIVGSQAFNEIIESEKTQILEVGSVVYRQ